MSLCPDTTLSSSAAMPEQSADVSSTPLHAHAVSWVSTSSTTCRMYSTGQPLCLPVQAPKHTEISSQIDGRKNSRANHPAFFILKTRNRGDAYIFPWFWPLPSTKSGFLCAFDLQNPHFQAFRAQNRHFCVRMGDFSEIFGRFDTKMGFLCSGREVIGTGKRNRFLPANHRAGFQNANTS